MSYEQLGRDAEAGEAYARYLVVEPENQSVLTHTIQKALTGSKESARSQLESLAKAGVKSAELMAALSDVAGSLGDNEAALTYATNAIQQAPGVPM